MRKQTKLDSNQTPKTIFHSNVHVLKTICVFCFFVIHIANSFVSNSFRIRRETSSNGCVLPPHPIFGQWLVHTSNSSLSPGQVVSTGTILLGSCQGNYKLEGDDSILCINGRWTAEIGQCLKKCPPLHSTAIRQVTCTNDNRKENCTEPVNGTKAYFKCDQFYEISENLPNSRRHLTCLDGRWSEKIPECVPVCGQKAVTDAPTLIVKGNDTSKNSYPWQVAIYNASQKIFLCGGSLLNQRVILTAAHCVTDECGKLLPKDHYIVAVGKYYKNFSDHRDFDQTQFSLIEDMFIPEQYRGYLQNYLGDVALLVTKETLTYSYWVQPVCVDWNFKYQNAIFNYTKHQIYGYISGWGHTSETGKPADVLRELKVPLITKKECLQNLPADNDQYLTYDKLCAGYLNSSTSACNGDSGGGLVLIHKHRHYVVGIVSISPRDYSQARNGCDSQQYTLYTNISHYITDFILPKETRIRALITCEEDPGCKDVTTEQPPDLGSQEHINSSNETCPSLLSTASRTVTCYYKNAELNNCIEPVDGTEVRFKCAPYYEFLGVQKNTVHICNKGKWYSREPICVPVCGKWKGAANETRIITKGNSPWQVSIFKRKGKTMACAGSLISARAVFTAADCVTNTKGNPYPVYDFTLAVGNYNLLQLLDSQDSKEVQISTVHTMFIHPQYKGANQSFAANIALLIANTSFTFSPTVLPVCVDFSRKYVSAINEGGYAVGWCCTKKSMSISNSFMKIRIGLSPSAIYHKSFPAGFYARDKLSAFNLNNPTTICEGNYGGGLVFNHDGRYYLIGIRSTDPARYNIINYCRPTKLFSFFTKVYDYMDDFVYDLV